MVQPTFFSCFFYHAGDCSIASRQKNKVVFILGSTGSGKSKLAISLALRFDDEIVNSDKIQVHDGLNVIANKVTEEESVGIPHHLIGGVHPDADFTPSDFRREAACAIESILARGRLPIIAGGLNTYIKELVDVEFLPKYSCIFVWVFVEPPVLDSFVSAQVDKMVDMGLVEEARGMFNHEGDYSRGIQKAIGMLEMNRHFRAEGFVDEETKARLLEAALDEIKANTYKLAFSQLEKIQQLSTLEGWNVHKVDATQVFLKKGKEAEETWDRLVRGPSVNIVGDFLHLKGDNIKNIDADDDANKDFSSIVVVAAIDANHDNVPQPQLLLPRPILS